METQDLHIPASELKLGDRIWSGKEWGTVSYVGWAEPPPKESIQAYRVTLIMQDGKSLMYQYKSDTILIVRRSLPKSSNPTSPDQARQTVVDYINGYTLSFKNPITIDSTFVVWFSKTLQNWKALVGTTDPGDHIYYEVTYNGDKQETYIDVYQKMDNVVVPNKRNYDV